MSPEAVGPLPICRVGELDVASKEPGWLVESLWSDQAVGFVAGQPKLGKTWLALDLALSVATGTPCLDTYAVKKPGPVLVYLAEDPPARVRQRLAGLCRHRAIALDTVAIHVITADSLRLDLESDRGRLEDAIARIRPRLLVLDPLVRLHQRDENHSGDIALLLSYLRALQRRHALAIVVVHHMRKTGAGRGGQALRGSSDLHAWTDSALYLQAGRDAIQLSVEHRAAKAMAPIAVRLVAPGDGAARTPPLHLELVRSSADTHSPTRAPVPDSTPLPERLLDALREASRPLTRVALRAKLRVNNQRLGQALEALEQSARVERTPHGWRIEQTADPGLPFP